MTNHSLVCGINCGLELLNCCTNESFPRMWDQLQALCKRLHEIRIIPTYVGSTHKNSRQKPQKTNHSHVCGINQVLQKVVSIRSESFPRMWDQPLQCDVLHIKRRIIPTYVGSTSPVSGEKDPCSNHSHVCGINMLPSSAATPSAESFPRMWDQPDNVRNRNGITRIIPTYVGSTAVCLCR